MVGSSVASEIEKLAHQLGVPAEQLACLDPISPEQLRELRAQIGDALFEAERHRFTRMALLSKAVPVAVAAKVSEAVLPPLLAARTAELFDPHRAVEMVARMSDAYLANVAAAMDPSRSPEVVVAIPPERVALVGRELARRREWVVMGAFVSFVSPAALRAAVQVLTGEQLLRISFVLDDTNRLAEISELLSDRQVDQILQAAMRHELWRELDELVGELGDKHADRLAERLDVAGAEVCSAVTAAHAAGRLGDVAYGRLAR
jgi:hypothetical protein